MPIHSVFDLLASASAMLVSFVSYRWRLAAAATRIDKAGFGYALALVGGAALGGYGFGTLNLWLTGIHEIARSIVGAMAGAIFAVEVFKYWRGIRGSTGLIFVPAFATTVAVGRWGCFFAGLPDQTYGTATGVPWAVDFGDGIPRHPVQLYESFSMLAFLMAALVLIELRNRFFMANGFYLLVIFYAAQRFLWEFLKPYGAVVGPFNLFHLICAALVCYGMIMISGGRVERTSP